MKKILSFSLFFVSFCFLFILNVKAMTVWKYEDWQAGTNYGSKTKVSSNITNLKGEKEEDEGMKVGPFNKASKAKLSDGIKEEVFVGLNKDNYENGELFELSIAINKKEANKDGYTTVALGNEGTIRSNELSMATFVNTKNLIVQMVNNISNNIPRIMPPNTMDDIISYFILFITSEVSILDFNIPVLNPFSAS